MPFQNLTKLSGCVDYFLAGAYDMVGTTNTTWTPLFPGEIATNSPLPDIEAGLELWGERGVPSKQLLLSVPWYGFLAPCDAPALGSPCRAPDGALVNKSLAAVGGE